jgi:hypothetical protein
MDLLQCPAVPTQALDESQGQDHIERAGRGPGDPGEELLFASGPRLDDLAAPLPQGESQRSGIGAERQDA